jgi:hypothetical protein
MDRLINFLLLIICIVIICTFLFNKENIERFRFSNNDKSYYHDFNKNQRKNVNLFVEDDKLILKNPRLNNVLRDVNELMNYDSQSKNIYDLTRVKNNREFTNNLEFW